MNKVEMYKFIKTKSGAKSVFIKQVNQKPYHLHSTVDPKKEALEWASHIEMEENTTYIVFGCGLGYHIHALWNKLPENSILFIFITEAETKMVTEAGNSSPVFNLQNKRLYWINIFQLYDIAVAVAHAMIDFNVKKVKLCKYYPAMRLNADFYDLCEETLVDLIGEKMALTFNVNITTGRSFIENYWRNMPYITRNPGIAQFENLFQGWPCIVVAGGPSLNKNINVLKECIPYAVVIAAGSTMGALHKHGITPHFLVVTDANPAMFNDLEECCDENTVLVVSNEAYHKVVATYPGRCCFTYTSDDDRNILAQNLPATMKLTQTSSVATVAVDFARHCGADKIIMVGQDLAFSAEQYHAEGVKATGYEDKELVEVPGYYGGMVPTMYPFKAVIEYLESYVKSKSHIRFINATEGGAKLPGMEQMPLQEVKERFLPTEVSIKHKVDHVFENFNVENSDVVTLKSKIIQYQAHCRNILLRLEKYEHENPEFKVVSEDMELDLILLKTKEINALFDEFKNHALSSLYRVFLIPRLRLVEFYKQDRLHASVIYELYLRVFNEFKEFIENLSEWINEALIAIEKNTGIGLN